jgi:hypothetical protein
MAEQCGARFPGWPHVWTWDAVGQVCRVCRERVDTEADDIAFDLAAAAERDAERRRDGLGVEGATAVNERLASPESPRCVICTVPIWYDVDEFGGPCWTDCDGVRSSESPEFHDHEPRAQLR